MEQGHTGTTDGSAGGLPPDVAAAMERLESLGGLPTSAHVAAFDDVQRRLHDALADIDGTPATGGGQPSRPPTSTSSRIGENMRNAPYPRPPHPHPR